MKPIAVRQLSYFTGNGGHVFLKGEEVWCPDGLGRVEQIIEGTAGSVSVAVNTYNANRGCYWDKGKVFTPGQKRRIVREELKADKAGGKQ